MTATRAKGTKRKIEQLPAAPKSGNGNGITETETQTETEMEYGIRERRFDLKKNLLAMTIK